MTESWLTLLPVEALGMGKAQTTHAPMTNEQRELVQTSWQKVAPIADTVAMLFYDRLLEIGRFTQPLFSK
jgi:hypothetical protein